MKLWRRTGVVLVLAVVLSFVLFKRFQYRPLRALAPLSMTALGNVVEAKLENNETEYVQALFNLLRYRAEIAPELLPSDEFIAAHLQMYQAYTQNIDERATNFLAEVESKKSTDPLYDIAKVSAKAESLVLVLTRGVLQLGFEHKSKKLAHATWFLRAKLGNTEGGMSLNRSGFVNTIEDARVTVKNLSRVPLRERLFRNILVSRFVWNAVQMSWFLPKDVSNDEHVALYRELRKLTDEVSSVDRRLLDFILEERTFAQENGFDAKEFLKRRYALLDKVQKSDRALCNPREHSIVPDFILQTLRLAKNSKNALPSLDTVWGECLVGAKIFFPTARYSEEKDQPITVVVSRYAPGPASRLAGTGWQRTAQSTKREQEWLDYLKFSHIDESIKLTAAQVTRCVGQTKPTERCLQYVWLNADAKKRNKLLPYVGTVFPDDVSDCRTQLISAKIRASQEVSDGDLQSLRSLSAFYPSAEWYQHNHSFYARNE